MPAPELYVRFSDRGLFTVEEAAKETGVTGQDLSVRLSRLQKSGYVRRVRTGLYAVVPPSEVGRDRALVVNPYFLASKLASPYALVYHTALELHGVAQSPFHVVFVATPRTFRPFEFEGVRYRRVAATPEEVEASRTWHSVEGGKVAVTSREWTLAHCALRLDLAGGLEEFLKSARGFSTVDPQRLLAAAQHLRRKRLYNRLGYLLDLNRDKWHLKDKDLAPFRRRLSKHADYFGAKKGDAHFVRAWNVLVPKTVQEARPLGAQ